MTNPIPQSPLVFKIKRTSSFDPKDIITQLPADIQDRLGICDGTGFHLTLNRRDMFCEGGDVQYVLESDNASVFLND